MIDTSAIVAILFNEPDAEFFAHAIARAQIRYLSAVSRVEGTFVVESRKGGRADLDRFLREARIEILAVTPEQAEIACDAFRRYGKGRHPANLNFGDVFAYALAKATGEQLLFKGGDFARTDIAAAAR